jgi:hypothetical protein
VPSSDQSKPTEKLQWFTLHCDKGKDLPARAGHSGLPLWIPLTFLLATTAILVTVVASGLREIIVALTILAVGIPVYIGLRWRYWSSPTQETNALR